jgi:hypothetical protein
MYPLPRSCIVGGLDNTPAALIGLLNREIAMPKFAEIKAQLTQEFGLEDGAELDAFAAIGAFLSGSAERMFPTGAVTTSAVDALTQLNDAIATQVTNSTPQTRRRMRELVMETNARLQANDPLTLPERTNLCRLLQATKPERAAALYGPGQPVIQGNEATAFEGVLQNVLLQNERQNNFHVNHAGHPYLLYSYTGLLSAESFLRAVNDGYQWKDIGVSERHGVFSHRIQWYLIAKGGFLNAPQTTFKAIGNARYTSDLKDLLSQSSLWARLCDRPDKPSPAKGRMHGADFGTGSATDLRSPERVTAYIQDKKDQLPWLYATVQKSQEKYKHLFGNDVVSEQQKYHAKKTTGNNRRFDNVEAGIMRRL